MHGHTQRIISSSLSREQTGHDVPRWMPFCACNSLLRSFQPRLACNQVVCSHLVQECGGGPAVGSTSSVSSGDTAIPLTQAVTLSLNSDCLRWKLGLLLLYVKNHNDIPKQQFVLFPWTQYSRADQRTASGRHPGNQEGAFYEGISLFIQENGSILLYIVRLLS